MAEFTLDKGSDQEDCIISDESSDDENFSESMREEHIPGNRRNPCFDEECATKSLRAYASSIDF
jgi:hypothetical protein